MGHITRAVESIYVHTGHSVRQAFACPNQHYHKNWNKVRRTQISLIKVYLTSWFNTSPFSFLLQPLRSSFNFHTTPAHSLHNCYYPHHPKSLFSPLSQCHFHLHTHIQSVPTSFTFEVVHVLLFGALL